MALFSTRMEVQLSESFGRTAIKIELALLVATQESRATFTWVIIHRHCRSAWDCRVVLTCLLVFKIGTKRVVRLSESFGRTAIEIELASLVATLESRATFTWVIIHRHCRSTWDCCVGPTCLLVFKIGTKRVVQLSESFGRTAIMLIVRAKHFPQWCISTKYFTFYFLTQKMKLTATRINKAPR